MDFPDTAIFSLQVCLIPEVALRHASGPKASGTHNEMIDVRLLPFLEGGWGLRTPKIDETVGTKHELFLRSTEIAMGSETRRS